GPAEAGGPAVILRVPRAPAGVRIARAAVTCEATAAGLTIDRIDDARQVVAELAALWPTLDDEVEGSVTFELARLSGLLRILATASTAAEPDQSSFAWSLIGELSDAVELVPGADGGSVMAVIAAPAPVTAPAEQA
ncbi:MAG: hypothetical protein ACH36H_12790, partial [Candidatus Nanopelagicales bacterium]